MEGMSKRKQYSDDFRADCVLMLEAAGYPDQKGALTAVAKKVKVPARTISRWFNKENNPPPDNVVSIKKGELVDKLETAVHMMLDSIVGDISRMDDAQLKELLTSLGIGIDKLQLLTGGPTEQNKTEIKFVWETNDSDD